MNQTPNFLRRSLVLTSVLLGATTAFACGSDKDSDSSSGSGTGGENSNLDTGTGSNGNGNGGPMVGGSVDLTAQEVDDILNASCTGWSGEGEALPATLQFVVDTSLSMTYAAPGGGGSRWDVTRSALEEAIANLPPSVSAGLLFYPNRNTNSGSTTPRPTSECVRTDALIPIAPLGQEGSDQRNALQEGFDDATVNGYTPTHDAYSYALENGLLPYAGGASKFMVVITDGAPTLALGCTREGGGGGRQIFNAPTQPIIDDIEAANDDHGVRTFLIGAPGSEESTEDDGADMRPWLSRAAMVGGTAAAGCSEEGPSFCHMDMTEEPDFSQALRDGLAAIAGQIIDSCTFAMPDPPAGETIDPSLTNVIITWGSGQSTLVLGSNTGDCSVGWQANGADELTLCEETCNAVKADSDARLHLAFGCGSEIVPVR